MEFFKCVRCGIYADDGNPEEKLCAMCILGLFIERLSDDKKCC